MSLVRYGTILVHPHQCASASVTVRCCIVFGRVSATVFPSTFFAEANITASEQCLLACCTCLVSLVLFDRVSFRTTQYQSNHGKEGQNVGDPYLWEPSRMDLVGRCVSRNANVDSHACRWCVEWDDPGELVVLSRSIRLI